MIKRLLEKWGKIPRGAKASIAYFTASLLTAGISYITTPLYTRLLTTEEYGRVSVFLTWQQLFGIVAMFCLSYGVFNNGMIDYPEKRDEYSFSMLVLSNIITLCFSAILLCLYPMIKNVLNVDLVLIILMCIVFFFQPAYSLWFTRQRYEYKYKSVMFWSAISAIATSVIPMLCIYNHEMGDRLYPRLLGTEISLIVIYIGFYIYLGNKNSFRINTKYWKAAFIFNLPLIPHYLSSYLLASSDKLMISNLVDNTSAAYYSIAYSVATVTLIVWTAANASLVPYTYEKCKIKDFQSLNKVALQILVIFAVICMGVVMFAPEVVWIMAPDEYMEAIYVIPPLVGGIFFQVQYYIYANVIYFYKKPTYVMVGSITATIMNLILNYIFIKRYGYIVAGYTTIFCYMVQANIDFFAMRKVAGNNVYDIKKISILSVGVVAVILMSNFVYNYVVIRYSAVGIVLVFAIIFRKNIIAAFVTLKRE